MTRKFICSEHDFELDLSGIRITETDENPWFTGEYYLKFSYPFTLKLTDDIDMMLGYISHHNNSQRVTMFNGTYVFGNTMEQAILEIEDLEDELSLTIKYGLGDFPNFSKKLSELPLHKENVADIYDHAATVVPKTWPLVNYNFPALHTDKIDNTDEVYADFMKIMNYYVAGSFPRNEYDTENEVSHNRNILQPLPYVLHILQAGFSDAGRELTGDILENTIIQKMLVYSDKKYYTTVEQESIPVIIMSEEYDSIRSVDNLFSYITLSRSFSISQNGRYRITGNCRIRVFPTYRVPGYIEVYHNNALIFRKQYFSIWSSTYDFEIDVEIDTSADLSDDEIRFKYDGGFGTDDLIFNVNINPIRLHDESGNAIATIINPNQVDLTKAVPDMTFGDFVKLILTMFNYSLDTTSTQARINSISQEILASAITDLSLFEKPRPKRTFTQGSSYLIKYEDVNSDTYKYAAVFQSSNSILSEGYVADDKTQEISFAALPLPQLYRNNILTAHSFLEEENKPMFVLYNGLTNGKNVTADPAPLLIPALHNTYLKHWYSQLIGAVQYEWTFITANIEAMPELKAKSRIHAYHNIHLIKAIEKTSNTGGVFEVTVTAWVI